MGKFLPHYSVLFCFACTPIRKYFCVLTSQYKGLQAIIKILLYTIIATLYNNIIIENCQLFCCNINMPQRGSTMAPVLGGATGITPAPMSGRIYVEYLYG